MTHVDAMLAQVSDARVLVVDDNPANTMLVRRILERAGLTDVIEVGDPTLVQTMVTDTDPDLILLDLRMPVMDGFEVLEQVRRHAGATYLPVIVVTADDSHESVERALAKGAQDFLRKPYNAPELVLRVRNLLLNRAAYKELRRSRAWLRSRLELFEPDLAQVTAQPDEIARLIRQTIADGSFDIAVQPVVDMRSGAVVGGEALARFPADVLGDTSTWFAAALHVDLVVELELAAVHKALGLVPTRPPETSLAINFSPVTILASPIGAFGNDVRWDRIVLELTEHVPVEDYGTLNRALAPFRDAGAKLAVDDTGAGFASLRHILDLGPDIIKLDIGITRGIDADPSRAAVAEMLVSFASKVGITVIAEGVETEAERRALIEIGSFYGQGYLLGRPEVSTTQEPL